MDGNMTLSDIAAVTKHDEGGFGFGSEGLWIFALLILLFGGGFGGFGSSRVGEAYATQADIQRAVDLDTLKNGQSAIADVVRTTTADTIGAVKDLGYNQLSEIRDIQNVVNNGFSNMQNCCCSIERAIDGVNYNGALNTANIMQNDTANTQKILDAIAGNRIADMQNQINALQLQSALSGVVRYPMQTSYCSGANPFGCGCGCSI